MKDKTLTLRRLLRDAAVQDMSLVETENEDHGDGDSPDLEA